MKRIILFLFVLMIFGLSFGICFNAQTTISTEGDGDFNLSSSELEEGYRLSKVHQEVVNLSNIEIKDSEVLGIDSFVICGRVNGNGLMYYPYLAYYKDSGLVFQLSFSDYGRGYFNDLVVKDDKILVIGNYEENDVCFISIFEIDFSGRITKSIKFGSDRDSYGYKILSLNNELMFVGATYASYFCGCTNSGTKSMVVGRLSYSDFNDNYVVSFGNESMDFHDAVSDGESIFILTTVNGLGYFSDKGRTKFLALLKMDHYCDSPEYISLYGSEVVKTSKMFIYQDHVCFMEVERSHEVGLVSYSKGLDYINMDIYTDYHLPSNIYDFNVTSYKDNLILSLYSKSNNKMYERRIVFDKEFKEFFNEEYLHKIDDTFKGYKFNNNIFLSIIKNGSYEITTDAFILLRDGEIYVNGSMIQSNRSDQENSTTFGVRKEYIEGQMGDLVIKYTKEEVVPLETNIVPFSTYDCGVELNFNAKGYLNGEEIESGYEVNDAGQYLLELVSTSGERESIYFTVGKLTIDTSGIMVIDSSLEEVSVDKIHEEIHTKEQKIAMPDAIEVVQNNYNYVYMALAGLVGGGIGFLLVIKKKKGNKADA